MNLKIQAGKTINSHKTFMKSASVQEDVYENNAGFEGLENLKIVTRYLLDNMIANLRREGKWERFSPIH